MSDTDTNLLRNTIESVQKPGWLMEQAARDDYNDVDAKLDRIAIGLFGELTDHVPDEIVAQAERLRSERDAALTRADSLAAEIATAHADARDADDAETLLRAWMAGNGDREKTQQWLAGENPWWHEANADARALESLTSDLARAVGHTGAPADLLAELGRAAKRADAAEAEAKQWHDQTWKAEREHAQTQIELAREKARREAAELDRASKKTARGQ